MEGPEQALSVGGSDGAARVRIGRGEPLVIIAGPCVLETVDLAQEIAGGLVAACAAAGLPLVFKASFDKANRTSGSAYRGPGLAAGLEMLRAVRDRHGVPVTTDVHAPEQAEAVAQAVDLLQVPAFLCRQTDLLQACGATGCAVNVKKGQFQAPWDMGPAVEKLRGAGAGGVMLTERGASFGYNNLVVDMRSLPALRALGVPVCFDATHSVQQPGGQGTSSGGERKVAPVLARAAVAVGVAGVFMEAHDDPDNAPSDGPNMIKINELADIVKLLQDFDGTAKSHPGTIG